MFSNYDFKQRKKKPEIILTALLLLVLMFSLMAPWSTATSYAMADSPVTNRVAEVKNGDAMVKLAGNEPVFATGSKKLKLKDANEDLSFGISLKPRNSVELDKLIEDLSNPASPNYHKFLTTQQFTDRFGATRDEVASLTAYLNSQGLQVAEVAPNNLFVKVKGKVAQVETAFNTQISDYTTAEGKAFFSNDSQISLPAKLTSLVNGVHLGDKSKEQSFDPPYTHPTSNGDGFAPAALRTAYNINPLLNSNFNGAGQTIAIFSESNYDSLNLRAYNQAFGLPLDGWLEYPFIDGTPGNDGQHEIEMDIEIAHAIAPGAKIHVYEGPATDTGIIEVYARIANDNTAKIVSTSWGGCEYYADQVYRTTLHTIFQQMAAQGQSIFAASGDSGRNGCAKPTEPNEPSSPENPHAADIAVSYPASDPLVTGVGGTTPTINVTTGAYVDNEKAWLYSGGGTSQFFDRPFYQNSSVGAKRGVPDVAAIADDPNGWAVYVKGKETPGEWRIGWGTSAGAPFWAGIAAINAQYRQSKGLGNLGQANPALYKLSQCDSSLPAAAKSFHDIIISGDQKNAPAGPGYDLSTGLGTPNVSNLVHNLNDGACASIPQQGAFGNQLINGGFENGVMGWKEYSMGGYELIQGNYSSHGGSNMAIMGGYKNAIDSISQKVDALPFALVKSATLTFWASGYTNEIFKFPYDYVSLEINYTDASGVAHTVTPVKISNVDVSSVHNWKQYTYDLTFLKGMQNIVVKFRTTNDASNDTIFYLDDVELVTVGS
jgi:kumamolisin